MLPPAQEKKKKREDKTGAAAFSRRSGVNNTKWAKKRMRAETPRKMPSKARWRPGRKQDGQYEKGKGRGRPEVGEARLPKKRGGRGVKPVTAGSKDRGAVITKRSWGGGGGNVLTQKKKKSKGVKKIRVLSRGGEVREPELGYQYGSPSNSWQKEKRGRLCVLGREKGENIRWMTSLQRVPEKNRGGENK